MHKAQWRLQDAESQFGEVVEAALKGEPQHISRRGREAVVLLSEKSYRALQKSARVATSGFVAHLMAIPKGGILSDDRVSLNLREVEL